MDHTNYLETNEFKDMFVVGSNTPQSLALILSPIFNVDFDDVNGIQIL